MASSIALLKKAEEIEKIVCKGDERKYYRFRPAKFYGGISTADCVGCNLMCKFCWAWNIVTKPETTGKFYSPEQVAEKLISIAAKAGFTQLRISGNEPTIGKKHLLMVLENLKDSELKFILETNGTLIDEQYARELFKYNDFLHVRVSLKGTNEPEFQKLTGFPGFDLQLNALKNLTKYPVPCHPAVIAPLSSAEDIKKLEKEVAEINPSYFLEIEEVLPYGGAIQRLKKFGLV